jgi:hypothetical protein
VIGITRRPFADFGRWRDTCGMGRRTKPSRSQEDLFRVSAEDLAADGGVASPLVPDPEEQLRELARRPLPKLSREAHAAFRRGLGLRESRIPHRNG